MRKLIIIFAFSLISTGGLIAPDKAYAKDGIYKDIRELREETGDEYIAHSDLDVGEAYFKKLVREGERKAEDHDEFIAEFLKPSISPSDPAFSGVYDIES